MTERMPWEELVRRLQNFPIGPDVLKEAEGQKNLMDLLGAAADEITFLRKLTGAVSQGESHADIKARIKSGG